MTRTHRMFSTGSGGTTYAVTKKAPSGTDNTELWGNSRVTAIKRCNDAVPLPSKSQVVNHVQMTGAVLMTTTRGGKHPELPGTLEKKKGHRLSVKGAFLIQ